VIALTHELSCTGLHVTAIDNWTLTRSSKRKVQKAMFADFIFFQLRKDRTWFFQYRGWECDEVLLCWLQFGLSLLWIYSVRLVEKKNKICEHESVRKWDESMSERVWIACMPHLFQFGQLWVFIYLFFKIMSNLVFQILRMLISLIHL
jgi:hypothetical protein